MWSTYMFVFIFLRDMVICSYYAIRGIHKNIIKCVSVKKGGPGSVVGITIGYGLGGPGIGSRWGRDFPHLSRPVLGPTQLPVQWVPGLSRGKMRPGRDADPSPLSSAVVMKE